ncbi:FeoA family protein [Pseudomarimonas arenosa]|uniref:Ferrous iron transport protein A n=1 Tax=Pseudomarimonas arenosa TaxID=2774145 RepID=A0AAW3ZPE7_9GAMM|nr:FeoA family protein [Pseudomarimonas arenosa]MBD8526211.1 ferrous iron transport protein A [Pseudomarimonas arenosa]
MQSLERSSLADAPLAEDIALAGAAVAVSPTDAKLCGLNELERDQRAVIEHIKMPELPHGHGRALVLRLLELGFVPGEQVRIIATGPGGREPIAVRVAGTTFALRLHEAEHIRVRALRESS